uniref:Uncharacterized protein n=1 Tax=Cacopsylla melanoneura TaxID=428564 RepID=A0A8D9AU29_9HEMI
MWTKTCGWPPLELTNRTLAGPTTHRRLPNRTARVVNSTLRPHHLPPRLHPPTPTPAALIRVTTRNQRQIRTGEEGVGDSRTRKVIVVGGRRDRTRTGVAKAHEEVEMI